MFRSTESLKVPVPNEDHMPVDVPPPTTPANGIPLVSTQALKSGPASTTGSTVQISSRVSYTVTQSPLLVDSSISIIVSLFAVSAIEGVYVALSEILFEVKIPEPFFMVHKPVYEPPIIEPFKVTMGLERQLF